MFAVITPPLISNLSQMNATQTLPSYFFKIHLNIILYLLGFSSGFFITGFADF
jgi:hypothetical protein